MYQVGINKEIVLLDVAAIMYSHLQGVQRCIDMCVQYVTDNLVYMYHVDGKCAIIILKHNLF